MGGPKLERPPGSDRRMRADLPTCAAMAVGLSAVLACGPSGHSAKDGAAGGGGNDAGAGGSGPRTFNVPQETSVNVDILFMIDNSLSMLGLQQKLISSFGNLTQALAMLGTGMPNLHVAVVSSDMGAGANSVTSCNNDHGVFHSAVGPGSTCASTGLMPGATFISNVGGQANYTGKIEDVLGCIAALGEGGCSFEAQLASVARALGADGAPAPAENAGFLRPDAMLVVVLFTNEDDCSVPPASQLFVSGPGHQLVSDPEGPLTSYRCNEFGHLCNGAPPPRTRAAMFPADACVPAEEQGQLIPVHTLVEQIKGLKADPSQILVAVVGGIPDPYNVILTPPALAQDPSMWPAIDHSCLENSREYADPGVRLAAFVRAFGDHGLYLTICAPSFAPALEEIATRISRLTTPWCLDLSGIRPLSSDRRVPDCQVTQQVTDASGATHATSIPPCDLSPTTPCWLIVSDALTCELDVRFMTHGTTPPPAGGAFQVTCTPCGTNDPLCQQP
jgi:hypothetical protein